MKIRSERLLSWHNRNCQTQPSKYTEVQLPREKLGGGLRTSPPGPRVTLQEPFPSCVNVAIERDEKPPLI